MRLRAVILLAALLAVACGREGGGLPDFVEVTCHADGGTSLSTRAVRPQADGVHVRLLNLTDDYARLAGVGGGSAPGATEFVSPVAPGQIKVECSIGDAHVRTRSGLQSLTVRDIAGYWIDPTHRCPPGYGGSRSVIDYAAPEKVVKVDKEPSEEALDVARKVSRLRPSDVVEIVGYPEADAPIVRFKREGRVTKTLLMRRLGGHLVVGGEQRCFKARTHRPPSPAPTPTPVPYRIPAENPRPIPGRTLPDPLPVASLEHGGQYWSVVLVAFVRVPAGTAGSEIDKEYRATTQAMKDTFGEMFVGGGDMNCDQGAREGLAIPDDPDDPHGSDDKAISVYFTEEAHAREYAAGLRPSPAGVARVTTYCLD